MKKLIIIFCLLWAGCASVGNKNIADVNRTSQIIEGQSTKADVQALLGTPQHVSFQANGNEIWAYIYGTAAIKPASFIPVIGIVAGGATSKSNTYSVYFNSKGIVEHIGQGENKVESGMFK